MRRPGEALVAPGYVGLCGTDAELLAGTMPYFGSGDASYPIQPGHEWSGVVIESDDPILPPGTHVVADPVVGCGRCETCRSGPATRCIDRLEMGVRRGMPGGAAEAVAVPSRNLVRIPEGLDDRTAVLAEPFVTVLAGIDRAGARPGTEALVIGGGTLGLIAAQHLIATGTRVAVAMRDARRADLVRSIGAEPVAQHDVNGLRGRYPTVIEAAGTPDAIRLGVAAVAAGGAIALLGVPTAPVDAFDVAGLVVKDATVHAVLNGPGRYQAALEALHSGVVRPEPLIDAEFSLDDAPRALERLVSRDRERPKVLLRIP